MDATHLLTILDPRRSFYMPSRIDRLNFLRLDFEDDTDPHLRSAPQPHHVSRIIAFARSLPDAARLAVNCEAGVSRSTAGALISLVAQGMAARDAAEYVLLVRPCAAPNQLMLSIADDILELGGALIDEGQRLNSLYDRRHGRSRP